MEENPSYWSEEVARQKESVGDEAAAWAEIVVEVNSEAMLDALYPSRRVLAAPMVETTTSEECGGHTE